jgi:hypothetical protein
MYEVSTRRCARLTQEVRWIETTVSNLPTSRRNVSPARPASTRTFFFSGPKSYNALQIPYWDLLLPTRCSIYLLLVFSGILNTHRKYPFGDLPFALSGNRVSRCRETCGHGSRVTQNPETRWVKESTLLFLSRISLSGNRRIRCRGSLAPQTPEP